MRRARRDDLSMLGAALLAAAAFLFVGAVVLEAIWRT